jgi:hypothetical protein
VGGPSIWFYKHKNWCIFLRGHKSSEAIFGHDISQIQLAIAGPLHKTGSALHADEKRTSALAAIQSIEIATWVQSVDDTLVRQL